MNRDFLIKCTGVIMLIMIYLLGFVWLPMYGKMQNDMQEDMKNGMYADGMYADGASDKVYQPVAASQLEAMHVDLTQKTVVIDSGHGGVDPGKQGIHGELEKDINLSIAKKLEKLLLNTGMHVVLTRSDDAGLYQATDVNKKISDMKKRCNIIDEVHADAVISIHQNSFQSASAKGAQVFYYKHSTEGKKLAQSLQSALIQELDRENQRTAKEDSTYYLLVHTKAPTVIAECGFLSNPEEAERLVNEEYQEKVAQALYYGIIDYFMHQGT